MKFSEYQELAMRTASPISRATNDNLLMQAAMGLCGEIGEFIEAHTELKAHVICSTPYLEARDHVIKELGDIMWYAITGMKALGTTGEHLDKLLFYADRPKYAEANVLFSEQFFDLVSTAGKLIDMVKKQTFHGEGHEVNIVEAETLIITVICWCGIIANFVLSTNLSEVMEKNIQKLRERYPDGFDADLSAHRKEGDV